MSSTKITPATLQILLSLSQGPLHGYGIKLDVAERTGGEVNLGPGTLYEAIQRLEGDGWIQAIPAPDPATADPRRQYFRLADEGEAVLREELSRLAGIVAFGRSRNLLPLSEEA